MTGREQSTPCRFYASVQGRTEVCAWKVGYDPSVSLRSTPPLAGEAGAAWSDEGIAPYGA